MNLNVVSFNILCVDDSAAGTIAQRAPRVNAVITPLNADLIGFQEATPTWLEHLNRDYGAEYEICNVYRSQTSHESTPIAWRRDRFECLDQGNLWFSDTPEVESQGWDELYNCPPDLHLGPAAGASKRQGVLLPEHPLRLWRRLSDQKRPDPYGLRPANGLSLRDLR